MSGNWNGLDLQSDFAQYLTDTSTSFKARVLTWMNDIQDDICIRYAWAFLRKSGVKTLAASSELQNLYIDDPSTAPTAALSASGSLTLSSTYSFKVTFYRSTDEYESMPSSASGTITTTAGFLTVALTSVPLSSETTVTARRVYVSKDSGDYVLAGTISDNTTTTYSHSTESTSTVEPPSYHGIRMLVGNPYLTSTSRQLVHRTEDDLRLVFQGTWPTGTPQFWAPRDHTSILFYPSPSSTLTLNFTYVRIPARIYAEASSLPTIPIWLKGVFEKGVLWKGYQFRERPLALQYMQLYNQELELAISTAAKTKSGPDRIRDVVGTSHGSIL